MEGLNLTPFLIGLGALLVGWTIGFFDSNNRTRRKIRQAEQRAEAAERRAEQAGAAAPGGQAAGQAANRDSAALLRLQRGPAGLLLDIDGNRVETSRLAPPQRKRLIELLTAMRPWLETGALAPESAPAQPISIRPAASPRTTPASAVAAPAADEPAKDAPAAPLTMVAQIDAILQARLAHSPLAGRGIRLQESPEGGVIVYVGMQKFPSVDAVPDRQIQDEIRAAIAEWELKFTPGL